LWKVLVKYRTQQNVPQGANFFPGFSFIQKMLTADLPTPLSDWKGHVLFAKGTNGTFYCPQKGHKRDIFWLSEGTKRVISGLKQDIFVLRKISFIFGTCDIFYQFLSFILDWVTTSDKSGQISRSALSESFKEAYVAYPDKHSCSLEPPPPYTVQYSSTRDLKNFSMFETTMLGSTPPWTNEIMFNRS